MPRTLIAFSPRLSRSRPSLKVTSSPVSSRALEAVADRVAMGEEAPCGSRHASVLLEEGLQGPYELGLVLVVVGDERPERLLEETLQLTRVLVKRGQQEPVGAEVLEGQDVIALRLGDVGCHQCLGSCPMQVDRIAGGPAARHRDRVARKRRLELAQHGFGEAARDPRVRPGNDQDELAALGVAEATMGRGDPRGPAAKRR